jgi:hypothetical protein
MQGNLQRAGAILGLVSAVAGFSIWVVNSLSGTSGNSDTPSVIFVMVMIAAIYSAEATSAMTPTAFLVAAICGGAMAATLGATLALLFFAIAALGALMTLLGLLNQGHSRTA